MKRTILKITGACMVVGSLAFYGCKKAIPSAQTTQTNFNNSTIIQFYLATVGASSNYIYADSKVLNGSAMSSGSIFPSTGYGSSIDPGVRGMLLTGTTTQAPLSFAENIQQGKNYTVFFYDTITAPKQRTVETQIVIPADTTVRLRFANMIYAPFSLPAVDVFSFNRQANVFTNVQVSEVTNFIAYPSRIAVDTFYVRETGTQNLLLKIPLTNLTEKRSYTLVYRGSHRGTRVGSLFANR